MFKFFIGRVIILLSVILFTTCHQQKKQESLSLFNGYDFTNWSSTDMSYWSIADSSIIGGVGKDEIINNQFIWHKEKVKDFYLKVKVKLAPDSSNAGIQFRSQKIGEEALGYQADVGQGVWGKLYHESGRKRLHWEGLGEKSVKKNEWNTYEILAIGPNIWTAINGTLSVAYNDSIPDLEGYIALQIHAGPSQIVKYKSIELIHNPKVELMDFSKEALMKALKK